MIVAGPLIVAVHLNGNAPVDVAVIAHGIGRSATAGFTCTCTATATGPITITTTFTATIRGLCGGVGAYPQKTRAFLNMRIQGESSFQSRGCQDSCTVRKTRSGWGIRMVARPSGVVSAVMPPGDPLGFCG